MSNHRRSSFPYTHSDGRAYGLGDAGRPVGQLHGEDGGNLTHSTTTRLSSGPLARHLEHFERAHVDKIGASVPPEDAYPLPSPSLGGSGREFPETSNVDNITSTGGPGLGRVAGGFRGAPFAVFPERGEDDLEIPYGATCQVEAVKYRPHNPHEPRSPFVPVGQPPQPFIQEEGLAAHRDPPGPRLGHRPDRSERVPLSARIPESLSPSSHIPVHYSHHLVVGEHGPVMEQPLASPLAPVGARPEQGLSQPRQHSDQVAEAQGVPLHPMVAESIALHNVPMLKNLRGTRYASSGIAPARWVGQGPLPGPLPPTVAPGRPAQTPHMHGVRLAQAAPHSESAHHHHHFHPGHSDHPSLHPNVSFHHRHHQLPQQPTLPVSPQPSQPYMTDIRLLLSPEQPDDGPPQIPVGLGSSPSQSHDGGDDMQSKKRSIAQTSDGGELDDGSKKKIRGRPRVEPQDQTPADVSQSCEGRVWRRIYKA